MARIVHGTLTANEVEEVALTEDALKVEILNRDGADEIYYLVDPGDEDPEVEGENCEVLVAAINAQTQRSRARSTTTVKLISAGTPKYTVRVANDD